jgi:hypothetical protein
MAEKASILPARSLDTNYVNHSAVIPHGLTVAQVKQAVSETYRLLDGINNYLLNSGFRPLEELVLGNSLSGLISEFVVKNIARASTTLVANTKVGGYPDLLPKGKYDSCLVPGSWFLVPRTKNQELRTR